MPRFGALFLLCSLAASLRAQSGWVVIPLKDYDQLRAKAAPPDAAPDPPLHEATLTRVDYDLRVQDGQAAGQATVTIDVPRDGWIQAPLPAGLLVKEARLQPSGKYASMIDGAAVFSKKGRYVLRLEIAAPVKVANGDESITLPVSGSGVTRVQLAVGRAGVELNATGGIVTGRSADAWLVHGRGHEPLVLSWRRKLEEHREVLPLRQRGKLLQWVSLGEDATAVWAEVAIDVLQGSSAKAALQVPAGLAVNRVPGANVADWEVQNGRLTVTFLEPVDKQTKFLVQAEAKLPRDGAIDVPMLKLLDVERETGGIAVEALGSAEIKTSSPQGLERTELAELGPWSVTRQSAAPEAFRFLTGPSARALKVEVARYTPQAMLTAIVEEARFHALLGAEGKTLVRARYAVRNNQRNSLKVTLPAGATLWTASLAGRPVRPGQGPEASLVFPLARARTGGEAPVFAVEVTYWLKSEAWAERGRAALKLPKLDLPVSRSGVVLFYPPRHRVTAEPGAFRAAEFAEAASPAFAPQAASAQANADLNQAAANSAALMNSQVLVDRFRARRDARQPVALAMSAGFPSYGPSLFLAAELTAENQEPQIEISFQRERKGGGK